MKRIKMIGRLLWGFIALALVFTGCAGKKEQSAEHFGAQDNHTKFTGWKDFSTSFSRVAKIYTKKELNGGPVLRPWVDTEGWLTPAFREKLCLVVTVNNHCVG